jgi:hypothetical protein
MKDSPDLITQFYEEYDLLGLTLSSSETAKRFGGVL